MAGDVKVAVVSGQISASSTGTADFTVAGFGTPKACIVLLSRDQVDNTSVASTQRQSIGLSDFTSQFCIGQQDENASAKVDCDAIKVNNKAYIGLNINGSINLDGTASTITDGVRLTNTSNTGATPFATVIMFGGADLTVDLSSTVINSTQDGTATIAHSGFTDGNDKLVFFIGTDVAGENSVSTGINSAFGVCHATGSDAGGWTFVQRCIGWTSDHNNAAGSPAAIISTDRVLDIITEAGAQDWGLEVTGLDHAPAEWTVATRDAGSGAGMEVYSLSLDLDDRKAKVGSVDSPTAGATWTPGVALGFTPQYVGLGLTHLPTEDTIATDADSGAIGISSNTGSGEEACQSWYNEDAAPTIATHGLFRSRVIDFRNDDVVTVVHDHSHLSFDSGGWTYTINTENETTAKKWFYLAIEEAAEEVTTGTGVQTLPSLTQSGAGVEVFTATGAQTLPSLNQSGVGVMQPSGTGAEVLPSVTQAGAGIEIFTATGAQSLPSTIQAGVGVEVFTATGVQTLSSTTQDGVGVMQPSGAGAQALPSLEQAGVGVHTETVTGSGAQALPALTQDGVGRAEAEGAGAQALPSTTQVASGLLVFIGTGATALPSVVQDGIGIMQPSGSGAQTLPSTVQSGVGEEKLIATGVQALPSLTQDGVGVMQPSGSGVMALPSTVQSGVGEEKFTGTGAQTLSALTQAASGLEIFVGTGATTLPSTTQAGVGEQKIIATGAQTAPSLTQAGVGNHVEGAPPPAVFGSGILVFPSLVQSGVGVENYGGSGAQILPSIGQAAAVEFIENTVGRTKLFAAVVTAAILEGRTVTHMDLGARPL